MSVSLKPARMRSKASGYCAGVNPAMVWDASPVLDASAGTSATGSVTGARKSAGSSAAATRTGLAVLRARGLATGLAGEAGLGCATGAATGSGAVLTGAGASFGASGAVTQPVRAAAIKIRGARGRHNENPPDKSHPHGERRKTVLRNMTVLLRWALFKL